MSIKTNLARVYSAMAEHQKAREILMELCEVLGEDPSPLLYDACVGIGHESRLMSDFETAISILNAQRRSHVLTARASRSSPASLIWAPCSSSAVIAARP